MDTGIKIKTANIFRDVSRYSLLIIASLMFVFALLSGSEGNGNIISGIIKNSPNTLPWLVLLAIVFISWKRELIGGILITAIGFTMMYFFNFAGTNFFLVTFLLTLLITLLGIFQLLSLFLRKGKD